jgi:penicillin amidase
VEHRTERIAVRGADAVLEEVTVTRRGPILTPALDDVSIALSLRATWLEPAPVRGFLDVCRARDFASFRDAFRDWPGPALNVVYSDAAGHIGWQLVGTLPRRLAGNGTLPLPAWGADNAWEAQHLPFDDLPSALDPAAGFVASANNAPRADSPDEPFLGVDWLDGYRASRIVDALRERDHWDVGSTQALQADLVAVPWRDLRPLILGAPVTETDARIAAAILEAWDGELTAGSAAASVYELTVAELAASLAREHAPTAWPWAIGAGFGEAVPRTTFGARTVSGVVARLSEHPAPQPLVEAALASAVRTLRERAGLDSARWAWGRLRPLRLRHVLGVSRPLDRLLNVGPVPLGGDSNTVSQAGVRPLDPFDNPAAIPNHRTVIDLADPERSRYVIAGGQSGNPLSPHYADLFDHWRRGAGVPIAWSPDSVRAATVETLVLRP